MDTSPTGTPKLEVAGLYKIFGPRPLAVLADLRPTGRVMPRYTPAASLDPASVAETGAAAQAKTGDGSSGGQKEPHHGKHTVAVRDVSFAVAPGEIFVVMGLSGSGKSTLVRCINRLIEPTAGAVRVDGEDVVTMDRERLLHIRRHKIAMVFQGFGLFPHRTVLDNVGYGLELRGVGRSERNAKAQQMIETVGLAEWGGHYPDELSGGMQQRVGLARALTTDPEILLMDEPFSALDPLIRRRMQDELLNLQERLQKTIVFITHDLDEALRLGNRIAIMKAGQIVQIGTPDEILLHPADDYVAAFVQHVDRSKVLRARDVMADPIPLLRLGHSPSVALREMQRAGLSSAFVQGPGQRLAGLITVEGAIEAAKRPAQDLRDAVVTDVATIAPDQSLRDLIPAAVAARYPLAVVDEAGRLLGIVPRVAILKALTAETLLDPTSATQEAAGLPGSPDSVRQVAVGTPV